jgi:putative restriction endonuclease
LVAGAQAGTPAAAVEHAAQEVEKVEDDAYDRAVRATAMAWLDERTDFGRSFRLFAASELRLGVAVGSERVPLVAPQQGIWRPRGMVAALSIRTTYTPPGESAPYADAIGADGVLRYKYRGTDPAHADNRALRAALERGLPLVWFWGVAQATYEAIRPVWVDAEEPRQHQFAVAVDEAQRAARGVDGAVPAALRRYVERLTRQRVHQPVFRAQVVTAYGGRCAVCRLHYPSLLDAAHILPDGHPRGEPVVPNGLSLCKIHHAAFDQNLIGIHPDHLEVEVRPDVRRQSDGPMLLHGLQEMHGIPLLVPKARHSRPDRERLEERWEEFRRAG